MEGMDLRQESTSIIRSTMKSLLQTHMKPPVQVIQPRSPLGTMAEFSPVPPPIAGTSQVHSAPAHGNGDNLSLNTLHNNSGKQVTSLARHKESNSAGWVRSFFRAAIATLESGERLCACNSFTR